MVKFINKIGTLNDPEVMYNFLVDNLGEIMTDNSLSDTEMKFAFDNGVGFLVDGTGMGVWRVFNRTANRQAQSGTSIPLKDASFSALCSLYVVDNGYVLEFANTSTSYGSFSIVTILIDTMSKKISMFSAQSGGIFKDASAGMAFVETFDENGYNSISSYSTIFCKPNVALTVNPGYCLLQPILVGQEQTNFYFLPYCNTVHSIVKDAAGTYWIPWAPVAMKIGD